MDWLAGRRSSPNAAVRDLTARADAAYRDAQQRVAGSAELAARAERRADRNSFGEAMIELFRGEPGGRQ